MGNESKHVTVVVYRHRHGEDVSVYATPAEAYEGAAICFVMEFLAEIPDLDVRQKISKLIANGSYAEAVDAYNEAQIDHECIEVSEDVAIIARPVVQVPKCPNPKCGCTDLGRFQISESYTAYHPVRGIEDGRMFVNNALSVACPSEYFDEGAGEYLVHCVECTHTDSPTLFGLPPSEEWEWV